MLRKILITGALGQLGKAVIEQLESKYLLIPTDILESSPYHNYLKLDISDSNDIEKVIATESPDIIINLAALTDVDGCELNPAKAKLINTDSVKELLKVHRGKFIQISTDYVFDGKNGPYSEDNETNPVSVYGVTKLDAELDIEKNSANWSTIRTNVLFDYDKDTEASFVKWVVDSLSSGNEINVVVDQWNNPTWTKDLAKVIEQIVENDVQGKYHYGGADYINRYDFALMIADVFGLDSKLIKATETFSFKQVAKRPLKGGLITDKIERALNIKINKLQDSLIEIKSRLYK